jgi:hypothetical protein
MALETKVLLYLSKRKNNTSEFVIRTLEIAGNISRSLDLWNMEEEIAYI